jgi:hypothetical protein
MKLFTEAYTKARDVLTNQQFEKDWQSFLESCKSKAFLGPKGFDRSKSDVPHKIRNRIKKIENESETPLTPGAILCAAAKNDTSSGTLAERAATLKLLRHLHRIKEKGAQAVWVYSPPKAHTGWVYDVIVGNAVTIKAKLDKDVELFGETEMKWMSAALAVAHKICEDTKHKLHKTHATGKGHEHTLKVVKRWFMDPDCDDEDLEEALDTLKAGFKKIAHACNSNKLVFTDYPDWRAQRDNYFGGAIRGGEGGGFPVVYLEGAFTRLTGNSGKQWLCSETIIHELSHHEVSTQDHRYDSHGLKPNTSTFPYEKAIDNADSWGYFALDLAGYLSTADRTKTWK